jgi:hypothetical protein
MNELAGGINVRCGQVPVARATNGVTRRRPRCRTAFSLFLAAHFLRLTQREPRPDSAGGISRHITALSIQRVLNPPGRQGSVALRRPLMR